MTIQSNAEQWEDGTFKTFAQLRLEDENAALRTRLEAAEKERDAWQLAYYERDIAYNKLVKRLEAATESNAAIASAHWELCKRLEAAERLCRDVRETGQALLDESNKRLEAAEDALECMVRQFAYEGSKDGRPAYGTGGLSALEDAFTVLHWDDPQPALDRECQAAGCHKWASCGAPTRNGYRWLCGDHYAALAEEE